MSVCVLIFRSIHDVLKAEKMMNEQDIPLRLIPVPKEVSADCGMGIQVSCEELDKIRNLLSNADERLLGVYKLEGTAFKPVREK